MLRKLLAPALLALALPAVLMAADEGVIPIPFEKYVLPNGLTLIVHEDHKAPIVAVNVWYDVGSGDVPEGWTGLAQSSSRDAGRAVLSAVSVDGRVQQRIASTEGDVREPVWSPYRR